MKRVVLGRRAGRAGRWDDPNVLVDVTAVLTTSSTLNAVAEAFSVPASSPIAIVAPAAPTADQLAWSAATEPRTADLRAIDPRAADPRAADPQSADPQSDDPQRSRAATVLDTLATLSRSQLESWANDPSAVSDLLAAAPAASEVADWWTTTDAAGRLRLIAAAPEVVGNLEGVPYTVRDRANRVTLSERIAEVNARLADGTAGRAATEQLRAQLHMLQQVQDAVRTGESGLPRTLVGFDAADGGRAVIAVGDLTRADYVSFLVPGMFYSVDSEVGSWAGAADQLAVDQAAWLARLTPAQHAGDTPPTVATVAWIGYHTPTVVNVASLDLAREGSAALTASLRGLEAVRDDRPYLSILAHSYGATAALLALEQNDVSVDALAMVGSPGSPAENVGQLRVRDGNVWVADAALDPIASTGVFGSQPLSAAYGAHHFGVDGAVDPVTGSRLAGSVGHVDYFTAGSESFRNMALIGIGQGRLVLNADGHAAAAPRALG